MVRRPRRAALGIAPLLALATLIVAVGVTRSEGARAEEPPTSEPTVVRELVEQRTADSATYLLSNGARRCRLYSADVHYRREDGAWTTIDATLVPVKGGAAVTTAAAPVAVTVARASASRPRRATATTR